jgi:hypothetical protein
MGGVLAEARSLWRSDRDLLIRIAGLFLFLPVFATVLLLPNPPAPHSGSAADALRAQVTFITDHLGPFVVRLIALQVGALVVTVLYCSPERPTVGEALGRAIRLLPRFLLASLLVSIPAALGLTLFVIPGLVVLARTSLTGPLLVAGRPLGAAAAVGRSVRATDGSTATLSGLVAFVWGAQMLVSEPLLALDAWLRAHGPNPVAVAMTDAAVALVSTVAGLAGVLIAIAAYRLLASRGT